MPAPAELYQLVSKLFNLVPDVHEVGCGLADAVATVIGKQTQAVSTAGAAVNLGGAFEFGPVANLRIGNVIDCARGGFQTCTSYTDTTMLIFGG
eukprot:5136132-Amphidinium_carterae.2